MGGTRRSAELFGALKRRRKYLTHAAPIAPEEAALIASLTEIRDASREVLRVFETAHRGCLSPVQFAK